MALSKRKSSTPAPAAVEVICVGSELLETHVNTHERYVGRRLRDSGLRLSRGTTVPDDEKSLRGAVAESLARCDALIVCGGLGPTFDDVTREAVAAALGRGLVYKPSLFAVIERKLSRHRMAIPERNKRQAFVIEGARALSNGVGSAPGQLLTLPRRGKTPQTIALLPGPYAELSPIFERQVLPLLKKTYARGRHVLTEVFRLQGMAESVADEKLAGLTRAPEAGVSYTILAGTGQVDFHVAVEAGSAEKAAATLERVRSRVTKAVGAHVFGTGDASLESAVGAALLDRGWTIAVAESCTGGGIGERLTGVAGSSRYFLGGVIAYDNAVKVKLLGVSPRTLSAAGAVSAECAREMAEGVRRATGATVGLSVTGIAGPGGGTADKPVGLVYIGLAGPGAGEREERELRLGCGRAAVRQRAAAAALGAVLRFARRRA
jgi:nicotinamide-nucleotide amidase